MSQCGILSIRATHAKKNVDDHISPASICSINVSDEPDLRALGDLEGPAETNSDVIRRLIVDPRSRLRAGGMVQWANREREKHTQERNSNRI